MLDIARKLKNKLLPEDTLERCGVVYTSKLVRELDNHHPDPARGFKISVKDLKKAGKKLAGTWHTHPGASSLLSQEDYVGFSQWPELTHYIIGTDGVRAYKADPFGIVKEVGFAAN